MFATGLLVSCDEPRRQTPVNGRRGLHEGDLLPRRGGGTARPRPPRWPSVWDDAGIGLIDGERSSPSAGSSTHAPTRGIQLTAGRRADRARAVLRHHRLLELYLVEHLGVPPDRVHEEAEALEHVISEDLRSADRREAQQPDARPARRPDSRCGSRHRRGHHGQPGRHAARRSRALRPRIRLHRRCSDISTGSPSGSATMPRRSAASRSTAPSLSASPVSITALAGLGEGDSYRARRVIAARSPLPPSTRSSS